MAKGYWIAHITVSDESVYADYLSAARIAFDKYRASFVVRGGSFEAPEAPTKDRHVIIEFPTYEQALACYHSPEYQAAVSFRLTASQSDIVIVEGVS